MNLLQSLLVSLIVLSSFTCKTVLQKAKTVSKITSCSKEVITNFFNNTNILKDKFEPVAAGPKIKEICPNLEYSCCTLDQVQYLKNRFLETTKRNERIPELIQEIKERIASVEDTDDIIKLMEKDKSKYPNFDFYVQDLNKFKEIRKDITQKIDLAFKTITEQLIKIFSGFGCEICSNRMTNNFHLVNNNHFVLRYNYQNIIEFIDIYTKLKPVYVQLEVINKALEKIKYIKEDITISLSIYNPANIQIYFEFSERCQGLSYEEFMQNSFCFNNANKIANFQILNYLLVLDNILQIFTNNLKKYKNDDEDKDFKLNQTIYKINDMDMAINQLYTEISEEFGVMGTKNAMNFEAKWTGRIASLMILMCMAVM